MTPDSPPMFMLWCPTLAHGQDCDPHFGPFNNDDEAMGHAEHGHACTVAEAHRVTEEPRP